jgi:hypothetical protein
MRRTVGWAYALSGLYGISLTMTMFIGMALLAPFRSLSPSRQSSSGRSPRSLPARRAARLEVIEALSYE